MFRRVVFCLVMFCIGKRFAFASIEDSVAIMYAQDANGGMAMRCTATAFERIAGKTMYLTAAHCVTARNKDGGFKKTLDPLFLSADNLDRKDYVRAEVVLFGNPFSGNDFAILSSPLDLPIIHLGDERKESAHANIVNVAAPAGVGKASFFGRVALRFIDRPLVDADEGINWAGAMLVDIVALGGSSGSSVVSMDTNTIIGVVVGTYHDSLIVVMPVSRMLTILDSRPPGTDLGPLASASPTIRR